MEPRAEVRRQFSMRMSGVRIHWGRLTTQCHQQLCRGSAGHDITRKQTPIIGDYDVTIVSMQHVHCYSLEQTAVTPEHQPVCPIAHDSGGRQDNLVCPFLCGHQQLQSFTLQIFPLNNSLPGRIQLIPDSWIGQLQVKRQDTGDRIDLETDPLDLQFAETFFIAASGENGGWRPACFCSLAEQCPVLGKCMAFNQQIFGTALLAACGRTGTPELGRPTANQQAIADFLVQHREAVSCDEIPADLPVTDAGRMLRAAPYLQSLVTLGFATLGTSWTAIDRVTGLLFGMTVAFAYLLCRITGMRLAAVAVAVAMLWSPLEHVNLVDLRDYSKAPFLLATVHKNFLNLLKPKLCAGVQWCSTPALNQNESL